MKTKTGLKKEEKWGGGVTRGGSGFHKIGDRYHVLRKQLELCSRRGKDIKWFVSASSR